MKEKETGVFFSFAIIFGLLPALQAAQPYYGKFLGKLSELHHGVSGEVYAVDARTLHLKDFTYDGQGPAAYFFAGSSRNPSNSGFRIRDERGNAGILRRYRGESVTITLPEGKSLSNIKWFSVWCEEFTVNFGDVKIPRGFEFPRPQKVDRLQGIHGVSSDNIVIVDAQTLLIPNLYYDGEAPDAKFWAGKGSKPTPQGIRVPDENGKIAPLRRYDGKTVVLTLPADLTVFDIGHFGIWCEAFTVDFGHVKIPANLNVPPSLKMLGISPQSKLNCEVLYDRLAFEVRWAIAGDSIVLQLVCKLADNEYMSFGLSGDDKKSVMVGGDVTVAWIDRNSLKGFAEDYFLDSKSQCSGPRGSCPDRRLADNTDSIRLLNAAMVNGYSIVTYQRPLKASDELDRQILTNQSQAIIWGIGPLNQRNEVSFHTDYTKGNQLIHFGRPAKWNCPMPESEPKMSASMLRHKSPEQSVEQSVRQSTTSNERRRGTNSPRQNEKQSDAERRGTQRGTTSRPVPTPAPVAKTDAWEIPPIECYEPEDGVFYAQMGPTGGKRGYPAITGHVGWGISWYINGLLIPEINVVRGKTYTFVIEGGQDPEFPAKYHPFYITDDPVGGYEYKTPEERQNIRIFTGARQTPDGQIHPTGTGRLCHWTHVGDSEADDFDSFGAYQRTLELRCDQGEPGVISWTPDNNTPDTVYYQCFTHRYLGWKINVRDSCDSRPEKSELQPVFAAPDLKQSSSYFIETRIRPNDLLAESLQKELSIKDVEDERKETEDDKDNSLKKEDDKEGDDDDNNEDDDLEIIFENENTTVPSVAQTPAFSGPMILPPDRLPPKPVKVFGRRPTHPRPPFMVKPEGRPSMYRIPPKKPYYRPPPMKRLPARPHMYQKTPLPASVLVMKPNQFLLKPATLPSVVDQSSPVISTEKPSVDSQTESSAYVIPSKLVSVHPNSQSEQSTMRPAINTGFHPESIVIEGGFKPMISKQIEDRMSDVESMNEGEVGVVHVDAEKLPDSKRKTTETFEPMFIPSPPDQHSLMQKQQTLAKLGKRNHLKKNHQITVIKHRARSIETAEEPKTVDEEEDELEMTADHVHASYLPPEGEKASKKASNPEIPPGSVVTYDGKTVSGRTLTASVDTNSKPSKASFLTNIPQFGPFMGEIPSLAPKALSSQTQGRPVTKLTAVRNKREAHHTPEHTEEQRKRGEDHSHHDHSHHDHHHHPNSASFSTASLGKMTVYIILPIFAKLFIDLA